MLIGPKLVMILSASKMLIGAENGCKLPEINDMRPSEHWIHL